MSNIETTSTCITSECWALYIQGDLSFKKKHWALSNPGLGAPPLTPSNRKEKDNPMKMIYLQSQTQLREEADTSET